MELSIETWKRNSFEIIDYDCVDLLSSFFEINEPGFIYRNRDEILNTTYKLEKEVEKLFEIHLDEELNYELKFNYFDFDDNGIIKTNNSAWFALIKNKMDDEIDLNRYELKEGEIIRIGRLFLKIRKLKIQKYDKNINLNNSTNSNNNINNIITTTNDNNNINNNIINCNVSLNTEINLQEIQVNSSFYRKKSKTKFLKGKNKEGNKEILCRICYEEKDEKDNPLIQPCNCHGSLKYIHLNCLKQWLKTNTYILYENNEFCKTYKYKEAECELCKTKLPDYIRHKGKLYEINDFGDDFKNYIIFECLTLDKNNNKFLYVASLDNNNKLLSIGRGNDCNLILSDASISRNHCALRFNNKKVFLEDCGSKFGTLILYHEEKIKLVDELQLYLQIGRSFIKCKVKKSYSFFGCCNISETKNFDFYYKQNKIKIEELNKMTVKTEIDYYDDYENSNYNGNNDDNEDEKNEKLIDEFDNENNIKSLKNNKIIIMGKDSNFDIDIYCPPMKLNDISECIDGNNNEMNKSDNNKKQLEISKERKNNYDNCESKSI